MFRFEDSIYLYLLAVIPLLAIIHFISSRRRVRRLRKFGDMTLLKEMMPDVSRFRPSVKFWLREFALFLLIVIMFARMTLFPTEEQPEPQIPGELRNIPAAIEHHALQWKNFRPTGSGNLDMEAKAIIGSEEVMSVLRECQLEAHREKMKLQKAGESDWQLSLWSRAFESTLRFALIYACS